MEEQTFTLKITFVDGEKASFEVIPEEEAVWKRGAIFERMMSSGFLSGVIDEKLVLFPMHRIACVEVDPAPLGLPGYMSQPLRKLD